MFTFPKKPRTMRFKKPKGIVKKPRTYGQLTKTQLNAATGLRGLRQPQPVYTTNRKNALGEIVWKPLVQQGRTNDLQSGPLMDVFRIIDSVHDIYDRNVQQKIKALLPKRELTSTERMDYDNTRAQLKNFVKGQGVTKKALQQKLKYYEKILNRGRAYPENAFVQDIFDFKERYGAAFRSINNRPFVASTFKQWVSEYLETTSMTSLSLSDMKAAWKNRFIKLAQQRNMTLFDQSTTCAALPHMNRVVDSKLTRTFAGNVIREFEMLLATDALKTSDTLSNLNTNQVTIKSGLNGLLNDRALSENYIVNMAQVVDPATNIKMDKNYRFAFVSMRPPNNPEWKTHYSTFYELLDVNKQFTCDFKLVIELMHDHGQNMVIAQLKEFIASKQNTEFVSDFTTTPMEFFKHVRVYVVPVIASNYSRLLSVKGLCIQTKAFAFKFPGQVLKNSPFYIHDHLSGFSVDQVVNFMQQDVPQARGDPKAVQWIIKHYLDWKRMGDSFQITHLLRLSQLNNARRNLDMFKPFYFASIDILAIIQAIMFNVNFVYQINGNAFVIGSNYHNTMMGQHVTRVMSRCTQLKSNRNRAERNKLVVQRNTNRFMLASQKAQQKTPQRNNRGSDNNNSNNNSNNGSSNSNNNYAPNFTKTMYDPYFDYSQLPKEDLLRLLTQCKQLHFQRKNKK